MSANLREDLFRQNARDLTPAQAGIGAPNLQNFWAGAGAFTSPGNLGRQMNSRTEPLVKNPAQDDYGIAFAEQKREDDLIARGVLSYVGVKRSQQTELERDQRASAGEDGNNNGVPDDEEDGSSPRSTWSRTVSQLISMAIDDINDQLGKTREEIALTQSELDQVREWLSDIKRQRAELAPQIAEQERVVENQKLASQKADTEALEQAKKVETQTAVHEKKQTEVTTQERVVAQKTVEEQQAAETLAAAKETTAVKTEEKVAADKQVDAVKQDYANFADGTIGYVNTQGNRAAVFKKTGPDGKEIFVTEGGSALSEQEMAALREASKNPDGTTSSDAELLARAKLYDHGKSESSALNYLQADNSAVYAGTAVESAKKDEQKAQTAWEGAAESLKVETGKLDTLRQELQTEQDKLTEEKRLLAEKQQKAAEEHEKLKGDEAKLQELKARDEALKTEQEKLETREQELTQKIEKLQQNEKKLLEAQQKLSDPAYQAKLKNMSPEQAAAELDKLPLSDGAKAQIAAEIKNAAPEASASPTAKGPTAIAATPSPTAEPLAAKASQSNGNISFANQDGHGLPDNDKAQKAFTAAASQTVAATESKKPEDELKVTTSAPTTQAPAAAMI